MRKIIFIAGVFSLFTGGLCAVTQVTSILTLEVAAIDELSIAASSASLVINAAVAGSEPTAATATTTYAITTNSSIAKKITGALSTNVATGTTLTVNLGAPTTGTTSGAIEMNTVAADLVTSIDAVLGTGLTIDYSYSTTASVGVVASSTRTLTLSLVST